MMKKAIFLDKDGVLIEETGNTVYKKEDMKVLAGVKEALKELKKRNYLLIVVTNQSAVARGLISEKNVKDMNDFLNQNLDNLIDSFYYCPHHPEMHNDVPLYAKKYRIKCNCRKPLPGMILNAAKDFDIDLKKSYMIGDMISDIIAGKSAGCKTILVESVNTGKLIKSHINMDLNIKPDFYSKSLLESLRYID
jgi:D-glycero-D-manno-heptose 1,7-bisphosphate phosphatase